MSEIIAHHNPVGKTDYLSIQHMERYRFAVSKLSPGMRVLDIACGAGYGTELLRKHGCEVVGADNDSNVLKTARRIWSENCFIEADALKLPFDSASNDAVVSFETIEHVKPGQQFLSEMYRVLRPGGLFICSTPNIRYTAHPPFHINEYKPGEFYALVQQKFNSAELYGQYFKFSDRLGDFYRWHVENKIVSPLICGSISILEKIGIKETVKNILLQCKVIDHPVRMGQQNNTTLEQDNFLDGKIIEPYRVKPYTGNRFLRIMIILAEKDRNL
ncbi:MAG: class I SAM-dependent methyltransferase [Desulfobulbaceae bacterium]|nr:class I SAM-dependent methyltransferase [Desulfobulbaceae bacterium]